MIFDTDVIIWALHDNPLATAALDDADRLNLSVVSYMELVRGARDKRDLRKIREYLSDLEFHILPLSADIGHRASIYLEEFGLQSGMDVPDALIAATAVENGLTLCSGNGKHYRIISELQLITFRPA